MSSYNKFIGMGNLTRDPELKTIPSGKQVVSFGMAINEKSANGVEDTLFLNCVAWEKSAVTIDKYCQKGDLLFIDGRLKMRTWEALDGAKKSVTEVIVSRFQLMPRRESAPEREYDNRKPLASQFNGKDLQPEEDLSF